MAMRANKIQSAKADALGELKAKIGDSKDFVFAEYRGLTVEQITNLRKQLRAKNAEFHVVKNNFARIAFDQLGYSKAVEPVLAGPTAVAFVKGEPNEVAKILVDFAKEVPALKVKAGFVDKEFFDEASIAAFSKLPGRNTLLAMLMSTMRAPVQNLVYTLIAVQEKLAAGGAPVAAEAPAPAAAEAPAAPAEPSASAEAAAPATE
ncbi:MAG TPA: 50S ribosomal protein L10 [Rectinemataceae bacterium]|nr:50S ribosomal protein L10 [Rectinemataceae bacterium]